MNRIPAMYLRALLWAFTAVLITGASPLEALAQVERLTTATDGSESNGYTFSLDASKDGRYIVFDSYATNLVPGINSRVRHIFLKDTKTGAVTLVSKGVDGKPGNGASERPQISADGRYVVFDSQASNLVAGAASAFRNVFLFDRESGAIERISRGIAGADTNEDSWESDVSDDGSLVVFSSYASNVVPNDTNTYRDIFLLNRKDSSVARINLTSTGQQSEKGRCRLPRISGDGKFITFVSQATNLPSAGSDNGDIILYSVETKSLDDISNFAYMNTLPDISEDGRLIVFLSQPDGKIPLPPPGIMLYDRLSKNLSRIDVTPQGKAGSGASFAPAISRSGRYVGFVSTSKELFSNVGSNPGIFVYSLAFKAAGFLSVPPSGPISGDVGALAFTQDDSRILFVSDATDLVAKDTNARPDAFAITNSVDYCPSDPQKTEPGQCGCGVADVDSDGDGLVDCKDGCPKDPTKGSPGACGCGAPDIDSDKDGTVDCKDPCPQDPTKVSPGQCGCGVPDTDSDKDGVADCQDKCPTDPQKKFSTGWCGCGKPETDSDNDGAPDCLDYCPSDSKKTAPGWCGCGVSDADTDYDGMPDCLDDCPNDSRKMAPGVCGCGRGDFDSDKDGTPDCKDECPWSEIKTAPGVCGCLRLDDANKDGQIDCLVTPTPTHTATPKTSNTPNPTLIATVTPTATASTVIAETPVPPTPTAIESQVKVLTVPKPSAKLTAKQLVLTFKLPLKPQSIVVEISRGTKVILRKRSSKSTVAVKKPGKGTYALAFTAVLPTGEVSSGKFVLKVAKKASVGSMRVP